MTTPSPMTPEQVARRTLIASGNGAIFFWIFLQMHQEITAPPFSRMIVVCFSLFALLAALGTIAGYLSLQGKDDIRLLSKIEADTFEMVSSLCIYMFLICIPIVFFFMSLAFPAPFAR